MSRGGNSQEMLMRERPQAEQKQEVQPQKQEEEIEFSKGGGGDGPKGFFRTSSFSSSVVCRPDPDNPGK